MKSKNMMFVLLCMAILFLFIACKSAPPAPEPEPEPAPQLTPPVGVVDPNQAPPDQALLLALDKAITRTDNARQLVMDFNGPAYFPPEWQSAETLFGQAERQKRSQTVLETRESIALYDKAAEAYEALAVKTVAKYREDKEKELLIARNAVVRVDELVPEYLADADNTALAAEGKYQAKDYYGARDEAANALTMYGLLKAALDAYEVREEIADNDFEIYDPLNIEFADSLAEWIASDYTNRDFKAAAEKIKDVAHRYDQALKTAWESFAAEKGADAANMRQYALDLKANVAVRQEFNSAQTVFTNGNTAFRSQKYQDAAQYFSESIYMLDMIIKIAIEKRIAAEEALVKANQRMAESDEKARNAELILEGGTP